MKKLFLILIIGCFALASMAQDATLLQKSRTYVTAGGGAGDTIDASATVTKTFQIKAYDLHQYSAAVFLDSISGTPDTVIVREFGSQDGVNYSTTPIATDTIATGFGGALPALSGDLECGNVLAVGRGWSGWWFSRRLGRPWRGNHPCAAAALRAAGCGSQSAQHEGSRATDDHSKSV